MIEVRGQDGSVTTITYSVGRRRQLLCRFKKNTFAGLGFPFSPVPLPSSLVADQRYPMSCLTPPPRPGGPFAPGLLVLIHQPFCVVLLVIDCQLYVRGSLVSRTPHAPFIDPSPALFMVDSWPFSFMCVQVHPTQPFRLTRMLFL